MSLQTHPCAFCWLFFYSNPKVAGFKDVCEYDAKLFQKHLEVHHGWKEEIQV